MSSVVLLFVNASRQDAYIWAVEGDSDTEFIARLGSGASVRQLAKTDSKWNIVANDSYPVTAGQKNRIFIIGSAGVYEMTEARPLMAESGAKPADFDFPASGGGGWP